MPMRESDPLAMQRMGEPLHFFGSLHLPFGRTFHAVAQMFLRELTTQLREVVPHRRFRTAKSFHDLRDSGGWALVKRRMEYSNYVSVVDPRTMLDRCSSWLAFRLDRWGPEVCS